MAEEIVDLFPGAPRQMGFDLGDAPKPRSYEPDREEVRRELHDVLATAKGATDRCPWDRRTFQYHKTVFPQMANWLPEDERDQLRFEFAEEVERLEKLLAA
ncbi:hypothetical protein [Sphingopyxis microcysteis]|jgi:hypothetical protein|uniref:hypothetical protein n=1 Tax=Sphingopyxis microcysteis TaxID=2484145 RepID=UPI001445A18A|nr:hypothetical protein [Sphingopyxis microcysteis]